MGEMGEGMEGRATHGRAWTGLWGFAHIVILEVHGSSVELRGDEFLEKERRVLVGGQQGVFLLHLCPVVLQAKAAAATDAKGAIVVRVLVALRRGTLLARAQLSRRELDLSHQPPLCHLLIIQFSDELAVRTLAQVDLCAVISLAGDEWAVDGHGIGHGAARPEMVAELRLLDDEGPLCPGLHNLLADLRGEGQTTVRRLAVLELHLPKQCWAGGNRLSNGRCTRA